MRYIHKAGILHRDLKPQNILIDNNYYPKVCDFGLSRCFADSLTNSMQLSMTGSIGTPLYMAPELYEDDQHYGPAVDVYAFAFLAYEIVTGNEPFCENGKSATLTELIRKIKNGLRPKFEYNINDNMKDLIEKCWSQDPKDRPSFDEIFEMLSSNFSFSDETVDEDELNEYLEMLNESRNATKQENELDKLKSELTLKNEENKNLQIEVSKLKNEIKNLHDEIDRLKNPDSNGDSNKSKCLHIKICAANRILSLRPFQKPDSYVTLRLKSQSSDLATTVYYDSNNPVWNEEFDLIFNDKNDFLIINMYNKSSKGDEKLMNQLELPVYDLMVYDQVDRKEIDIMLKKKKAGTLIFEVQALSLNEVQNSSSRNEKEYINWKLVKDNFIKILLISGDVSGKSALLNRFVKDTNSYNDLATIGVYFKNRNIEIDGNSVEMQIWDSAAQERFRSITKAYFKGIHGIIICFDVNRKDSLLSINYWIKEFKEMDFDKKIPIVLSGNMIDAGNREVSYDEAEKFASENGWRYFETSAKENIGVEEPFRYIAIKSLKYKNKI